ncbi:hypothetical protein FHEFKHOI_01960 [Candidatus Methanoperedenaceae archaeon GB50]|nr:hypothetical protein AIOGIFDO_01944 [Candidatus Methanoperedenaceae archaeon GB37]CAD7776557.1 hypothetical protein FHEFKHOI_01960 [Candidatus Methanoperedenaceae archaeon GB50]
MQRVIREGLIPILLLFLLIPQASGIGLGASPDRIDFGMVNPKEGAVRELYVINTGNEAERVMLTVEGVNLAVDPQEFDLPAKEKRMVKISIDNIDAGEYRGSILIMARPSGGDGASGRPSGGDGASGLGLGAALRVPVSFHVKSEIYRNVMGAIGLSAAIATVVILWVRRRRL